MGGTGVLLVGGVQEEGMEGRIECTEGKINCNRLVLDPIAAQHKGRLKITFTVQCSMTPQVTLKREHR